MLLKEYTILGVHTMRGQEELQGFHTAVLPEALNQVRQPLLPQRSQPSARRILAVDSDLNVSLGRILNLGMCP